MANRTLDRYDDFRLRPWPVSPSQYPLRGPSRGPVYTPTIEDAERAMKQRMTNWLYADDKPHPWRRALRIAGGLAYYALALAGSWAIAIGSYALVKAWLF